MTTERFKRRLTTILSADVKSYTRLMGEMIGKKPCTFVIIVLFAALLVGLTEFCSAQDNTQTSPTNEYINDKYGLVFYIPKGIDLYTAENPGPLASLISSTDPFIFVNPNFREENINVKVSENISESDLRDLKKMLDENPNIPFQKYQRISVNTIEIGKQKEKAAVEHVFIMQGNILGKLRQVIFVHRGRGFTFTCATAVDRFDRANRQFFQKVFDSIVFK